MHAVVEIVVGTVVVVGMVAALIALVAWRQMLGAVRLVPRRPTAAPLAWALHPCRAAQLHRRLRRSCRGVIAAVGTPSRSLHPSRRRRSSSPLTRVGAEVIDRAVAVDSRLVAASRLAGSSRRAELHHLRIEVRAVEDAARRVGRLDAVWREHQRSIAVSALGALAEPDLGTRVDAMEAAFVELGVTETAPPPATA